MKMKIAINGPIIGDGDAWIYNWLGIPAASPGAVQKQLRDAGGEDVEVYINSLGGSAFAGSEIYTALKEYAGNVTAKITGVAASAASIIAMGANKVLMSPTSQIMIHNASISTNGDKNVHDSQIGLLKSVDEAITNAYAIKTGMKQDELLDLMNKTTWMNSKKAIELGFADEMMFATPEFVDVSNSAAPSGELPRAVIDKLRVELAGKMEAQGGAITAPEVWGDDGSESIIPMDNSPELMDLNRIMQSGYYKMPISSAVNNNAPENMTFVELKNQIENIGKPKEETKKMDLNQLKNEHPEIYAQVVAEGVQNERTRLNELEAMRKIPGASKYVDEGIQNGSSKLQVMDAIIAGAAARTENEATNRFKDAQESGVNDVSSDIVPQNKVAEQEEKEGVKNAADDLAAAILKKRGVK